jgi:single-strand DNA-binding protein
MNNVQLIGNLARAVELRELGGNKVVGKSLLAVSRMHKGTRTGTDWIPITLWDKQAQAAARYLEKGSRVAIQGRLHGDYVPVKGQAEGEAKKSRLVLEVVVDRITYLSAVKRPGEAKAEETAEAKPAENGKAGR